MTDIILGDCCLQVSEVGQQSYLLLVKMHANLAITYFY